MPIERRRRRSNDPYRALCLQLEHACLQGAFDAVVLATDNGLVVAGAGQETVCEALGAIAPLLERPGLRDPLPEGLQRETVEVQISRGSGQKLYVAAAGKRDAGSWLRRTIEGAERILGRPWPVNC